jgi:hypothetical protein
MDKFDLDKFDLSRKMRRLTAWLDTQTQPDGLAGRRFHGVPFGNAYLTIDPERQTSYASANLNRVHLCGLETGMSAGGITRLIDIFANHGVRRFFAWLSPGPIWTRREACSIRPGFHATNGPVIRRFAASAIRPRISRPISTSARLARMTSWQAATHWARRYGRTT